MAAITKQSHKKNLPENLSFIEANNWTVLAVRWSVKCFLLKIARCNEKVAVKKRNKEKKAIVMRYAFRANAIMRLLTAAKKFPISKVLENESFYWRIDLFCTFMDFFLLSTFPSSHFCNFPTLHIFLGVVKLKYRGRQILNLFCLLLSLLSVTPKEKWHNTEVLQMSFLLQTLWQIMFRINLKVI